ncbi:hypothetical protein BpHYR1_031447 [Brachionus plicatilis]|uniref:Endonuclease/exonuclease/phosphatase domain-containing protein n=1 Tax=Brachionus plicatilis TaxID=10195 RepID=A0A3M7PX31_BRAPC|nr:hypothetical protein BpHYR1_031447 [Brachionus plicatilis]
MSLSKQKKLTLFQLINGTASNIHDALQTLNSDRQDNEDLIILGDLNAKLPGVGYRSLDANGRVLEKIIDSELD